MQSSQQGWSWPHDHWWRVVLSFFNLTPSFILVTSCFSYLSYLILLLLLLATPLIFRSVGVFEFFKVAGESQQLIEAIVAAIAKGRVSIGTASVTFYILASTISSLINFIFSYFARVGDTATCVGKFGMADYRGGSQYFSCIYFYLSIATCVQIILYALLVAMWHRLWTRTPLAWV